MTLKITKARAREYGIDPDSMRKTSHNEARKALQRPQDGLGRPTPAQRAFMRLCEAHGLPVPDPEFMFAEELGRRWRFDWLFDGWLAVEQEGGVWTQGRHNRGVGFLADMEKYNTAVLLGYSVLRFSKQQMESGEAHSFIKRVLGEEAEHS